jgi:hypothetical protein
MFCARCVKTPKFPVATLRDILHLLCGWESTSNNDCTGYYINCRSKIIHARFKKHLAVLPQEVTPAPNWLNCGITTRQTRDCEMGAIITKLNSEWQFIFQKYATRSTWFLYKIKQNMAAAEEFPYDLQLSGDNYGITAATNTTFCMKMCLRANIYNMATVRISETIPAKNNSRRICIS